MVDFENSNEFVGEQERRELVKWVRTAFKVFRYSDTGVESLNAEAQEVKTPPKAKDEPVIYFVSQDPSSVILGRYLVRVSYTETKVIINAVLARAGDSSFLQFHLRPDCKSGRIAGESARMSYHELVTRIARMFFQSDETAAKAFLTKHRRSV